jgi:hypothetical protein
MQIITAAFSGLFRTSRIGWERQHYIAAVVMQSGVLIERSIPPASSLLTEACCSQQLCWAQQLFWACDR